VITSLRAASILETISFIALLGVMMAGNDAGVSVVGMVHGLLFIVYVVLLWLAHEPQGWSLRFVALGVVTGPIGAIIVLERLRRDDFPARASSPP
jgi:integral membrane protein